MWRPMIVDFSLFLNRLFRLDRCDLVSYVHLKYKFNTMWKRSQISEIRIAHNLGWQKNSQNRHFILHFHFDCTAAFHMFFNVLRCRIVRFRLHLPFPDAQHWTSIDHSVTCETKIRGNSRVQMPNQRMNCFVLHKLNSGLLQWYSCKSFHNTSKYMNDIEKNFRALILKPNCKFITERKKYLIVRKKKLCL